MEKKEFKLMTKNCLENYGFTFFGKKFYLNLPNLFIRVQYLPSPFGKGSRLCYDILIKKIANIENEENLSNIENSFEDVSEIPVQMPALNDLEVKICENNISNIFIPEEIELSFWKKEFNNTLHDTFDYYKKNDILTMKKNVLTTNSKYHLVVNNKVKDYLGIFRERS